MSLIVHHLNNSRSQRLLWMLEELELPYEIRFYEREGLVDEPHRRPSGYRQYAPEVVRRIRFIRHAKDLGFTLREIKELLELRVEPDCHCGEPERPAEGHQCAMREASASRSAASSGRSRRSRV